MAEWKETYLGEYSDVLNGFAFKSEDFGTEGTPIIKIKNVASGKINMEDAQFYPHAVADKLKKFLIPKGSILIAMTGSHATQPSSMVGRVCMYDLESNSLLNQRVGKVYSRDLTKLNESFLFYFLIQDDVTLDLAINAGGSANQANISGEQIKALPISLPPIEEQESIAAVLSSLDDKINRLHCQNITLEALAETIFRRWFVEEAGERWKEKGLDEIANFLNGLACQKYPPSAGIDSLPVIKIKELRQGFTDATDMATSKVPINYIVDNGDILFSWSGSLEVMIWSHGRGILNQHLFKVSSEYYPEWFYYFWIKYHLPEFRSIARDKATTMGHIQRHHLSEALVVVPSDDELQSFDGKINPLFTKIKKNLNQIRILSRLRDTLLPKLMSGEVRVNV